MEDSKRKIIETCSSDELYLDLSNASLDEDIARMMKILEKKYKTLGSLICIEGECDKSFLDYSKQSEILGKLVMLVHEYDGFKGVKEVIDRIHWSICEDMMESIEEKENKIERLETEIANLKEKYNCIKKD